MARDCETLSKKAQAIFNKLKPFFPPNAWGRPFWEREGTIAGDGTLDLRKSADRKHMEEKILSFIGNVVGLEASSFRKNNNGSLSGFKDQKYSAIIQHEAEKLLILRDLDFQIETADVIDGCH